MKILPLKFDVKFGLFILLGISICVIWGCSKLQQELPLTPQSTKLTFQSNIRPILMAKCASCHNQVGTAEGNYDVTTIQGVLGKGTHTVSNAQPGNPNSVLLTVLQPGGSMAQYVTADDLSKIRQWIVTDNLYIGSAIVHPQGWTDPSSPAFHGKNIKDHNWDMSGCTDCHGKDFKGGIVGKSCESCHPLKSPGNCTTCHGGTDNFTGAPPKNVTGQVETSAQGVGSHTPHVDRKNFTLNLLCNQCHVIPDSVNSPGHIGTTGRATVVFSGIAKARGSNPEYIGATQTCSGVYCHGNFGSGNHLTLQWTDIGKGKIFCGECHSLPPQGISANGFEHTSSLTKCSLCHPTADDNFNIVRKDLHINGVINTLFDNFFTFHGDNVDLLTSSSPTFHGKLVRQKNWDLSYCKTCHGDDYSGGVAKKSCNTSACHPNSPENCLTCHGGLANNSGSPPPDINGNTTSASRGVGAHASYFGTTKLSNNVKCSACHVVPENYFDPGHINPPQKVVFKDLSTTGGAQPVWDPVNLRCSMTYCHGNFPGGNKRTVRWTKFSLDEAACGTCHGLPPEDPTSSGYVHPQSIRNCEYCHSNVVGPNLKIINKDLHINGRADQ